LSTENEQNPQTENFVGGPEGTAEAVENDLTALYQQIDQLSTERDQAKDQLLRTMADFQNFRTRTRQENDLNKRYATEAFVTALLPVLDNFERTVAHLEQGATVESMLTGVRAVERQLRSVLEGQNVQRIPAVGEMFDPTYHEAIAMEATNDHPSDTIIAEIEPGYRIGDKVVRPARVRVARPA